MIFSINFVLSVNSFKSYIESESQNHAQDTSTSLGLSLSPYMANSADPLIKTMASAIFDMGYYSEIRLVDANGKELFALYHQKQVEGVPDWFMRWLPMRPTSASSEISSGWTVSGVVHVTVNSAFAYSKLYEQAKHAFYYSLTAFAVSIVLLVLMLRITLASLSRLEKFTKDIAEGDFHVIADLPWTSEIRNLAVSMNAMSQKIAGAIAALNARLETLGAKLLRDDLSGFFKMAVFETDIRHILREQRPAYLVLIKADSLAELVLERGVHAIDEMLLGFVDNINAALKNFPQIEAAAYRFYGGEFALLCKSGELEPVETMVQALSEGFIELGRLSAKPDLVHIGVTQVNPVGTPECVLEGVYEAYEQARLIGANRYFIRSQDNIARDLAAWKELVFSAIDTAGYAVKFSGRIFDTGNGELIMEEAFTQVLDKQGLPVPIGPFVSIAEQFGKIIELDKGVIRKVLEHIRANGVKQPIAVNISLGAVKNAEFRRWLEALFNAAPLAAKQLVFGVSAYAVSKDAAAFADFIVNLHQWGGRVMIKRFETQSMSADMIKKLKPDFIRLAREIGNGVSAAQEKRDFVKTMQEIGDLLDIRVLAENVLTDEDIGVLTSIGIAGVSR